jgi:transcriptional regulator with XRE-family HTH domain
MDILKKFRQLVEDQRLTSYEIAKDAGVDQSIVHRILSGETKKPRNDTMVKLAKYMHSHYNISAFEGLQMVNEPPKVYGSNISVTTKSGLCWEQMTDGSYLVTVDLVPFEAHGRYLSEDPEYYAEWEQITFNVPKMGRGNYLGFKHKGESMFNPDNPGFYDIKQGMKSLARELGRWHWKDGFRRKDAPYGWILITNKNILHKDITAIDLEAGTITCSSRNPDSKYSDFDLELNDVYQIFKIITVNH